VLQRVAKSNDLFAFRRQNIGVGKRQKRQNGLQHTVVTMGCNQNTFGLLQIDTDPQRWRWPLWHICDDGGSDSSSSIGGSSSSISNSSSSSSSIVVVVV